MTRTLIIRIANLAAATALIAVACFVASPLRVAVASPAGTLWNVATEPSPTGSWSAVIYADGQWVAFGDSAFVAVSTNAETWTEYPVPAGTWHSVAYGNGRFVALSSTNANPEELVSTNGRVWNAVAGPNGPWTAITFGDRRFEAVSSSGQIDTSTNAVQWTSVWHHANLDFTSVAYGGGHFVATDSALGAIGLSTNGLQWSRHFPARNTVTDWGAAVYGEGEFIVLEGAIPGYYATSVYGYVWTLHSLSPAEAINGATFGCGSFVGIGQSAAPAEDFVASTSGTAWSTTVAPIDETTNWSAVGYGARRFVAVDTLGNIAWSATTANCAAIVPTTPQQVSGNIHSGLVWTYMHPPANVGGAPVNGYRVNITKGTFTRHCSAPVYFEPNCKIGGLVNHQVYSVTTQSHNRFGYSVPSDREFVIPTASSSLSATPSTMVVARGDPVVVQVTGVLANNEGIYPITTITVHVGATIAHCSPNPFGECLVTVANPPIGFDAIYATYAGFGRSYRSPTSHVRVQS